MTTNNSMEINEQPSQSIPPEPEIKIKERYYGTEYYDSYHKGLTGALMTLDESNKDKILENLIIVVLNDVIEQNLNSNSVNTGVIKNIGDSIVTLLKTLRLYNFKFDVKRIASIIEGYGKQIEQKNYLSND